MTRGPMLRFVVRRLLQAVPLLLGIVSATFIAAHAAPGDPMDMYLDPTRRRQADPELIEAIRRKHGLDQPIHVQYVRWVANAARGDMGTSFRYGRPVSDLLLERVPYTLQVTFLALLFGTLLGVALGIFSAVKQYSALDEAVTLGSLIVYAMPLFWLALMLVLVFSVNLGWFPTSQTRSLHYDSLSAAGKVLDRLWHLALPVFVLGVGMAASKARYMRNKLLEVLSEEYVLAARARGLPERSVIMRHALRNALIPVITMLGMSLPFLVGGSLFVESVFGWPGIGMLAVEATASRDYPLLLATTLLTAVMVVLGSLLADVLYAVVDPRVAYERRQAT
jgi:peptide/nickel transport system permease protein